MFENIPRVVEQAGGTVDDIGMVTVWLSDYLDKAMLNEEWLKLFPEEGSRPTRHVISYDFPQSPIKVQCQFIAVIESPE
jgi:enamine deaminase RidA (YjgF/YER057c/UK114 family)